MNTIKLNRNEVIEIAVVLENFPDVNVFELKHEQCGGLGHVLEMTFDHKIGDVAGKYTIPITEYDDW